MNLSELTTLRVGGPVESFREAPLREILPTVEGPLLVIGGGSNLLAQDSGFDGMVIRDQAKEIRDLGDTRLSVDAGVAWDDLVQASLDRGLAGFEAMSGIPGTVGAAPVQNIGAYGSDVADSLVSVRAWDREVREETTLSRRDLALGYRDSALKRSARAGSWGPTGRWVVLAVEFDMRRARTAPVRYRELAEMLGIEMGACASTSDIRQAVLELRRRKGMVLDPLDHDTWSAGSFFTNPIVSHAPEGAPAYPADGGVKTSAAWLIQHAGYAPGFGLNDRATLSTKHVLAITNRGDASSSDILELAEHIRDGVRQRYGITLVPEPVLV